MAGRPREPINLILAKGKKHLTKAEIKERTESEIVTDHINVNAPEYLTEDQKKEFYRITKILLDIGIITELDEDCLAHYLIANSSYISYTKELNDLNSKLARARKIEKKKEYMSQIDLYLTYQDRALKQCRACANDLGLSISSRAKLVMPKPKETASENKFNKFKVLG